MNKPYAGPDPATLGIEELQAQARLVVDTDTDCAPLLQEHINRNFEWPAGIYRLGNGEQ